jgi:hypothetical protein
LATLVENSMSVIENESPSEESKTEREHIKIIPKERRDTQLVTKATTQQLYKKQSTAKLTRQGEGRLSKAMTTVLPKKPLTKRQ